MIKPINCSFFLNICGPGCLGVRVRECVFVYVLEDSVICTGLADKSFQDNLYANLAKEKALVIYLLWNPKIDLFRTGTLAIAS